MKSQLLWTSVLMYLCVSCSPKSSSRSYRLTDPSLNHEMATMWIAPTLGGTIQTPLGVMTTENCYKIDSQTRLAHSVQVVKKHFESTHSNQEFLCQTIKGFEYQEGTVYKIKIRKSYEKNKLRNVYLDKILFSEIDPTFAKEETLNIWVHNQFQPENSLNNQQSKILVQYEKALDLDGEFTYIDMPIGYSHNNKYISQISINRRHISTQEEVNFRDSDQSFGDTFVAQIKKLVGNKNTWPSTILDTPTIARTKVNREVIRLSYTANNPNNISVEKVSLKETSQSSQSINIPLKAAAKKKPKAQVTYSPDVQRASIWINSSKNGKSSYSDNRGFHDLENCYEVNYNTQVRKNSYGDINVFEYKQEVEPICLEITGLEYEAGYIYLANITKHYTGDELKEIKLDRIITKEFDRFYKKQEILDVWIDDETQTGYDLNGVKQEYLKVQYSKKMDTHRPWQGLTQIVGFEIKPGYVCHIKMKRSHLSSFEIDTITDHLGYSDAMIELIEIYKKP